MFFRIFAGGHRTSGLESSAAGNELNDGVGGRGAFRLESTDSKELDDGAGVHGTFRLESAHGGELGDGTGGGGASGWASPSSSERSSLTRSRKLGRQSVAPLGRQSVAPESSVDNLLLRWGRFCSVLSVGSPCSQMMRSETAHRFMMQWKGGRQVARH